MPDFRYGAPAGDADLRQILELQRLNAEEGLAADEVHAQGFVTVRHDLPLLRDMCTAEPPVIARAGDEVAGYALVMPREFEDRIPILKPMFAVLNELSFDGRPVNDYRFFVMGQICVGKAYRGMGVFDGMYRAMRERLSPAYDFVVTEVATRNGRSLAAHRRVGFQSLLHYRDDRGEDWDLILWDWRKG